MFNFLKKKMAERRQKKAAQEMGEISRKLQHAAATGELKGLKVYANGQEINGKTIVYGDAVQEETKGSDDSQKGQ